ncbi:DUF2892 domain-containing protein [bacterium]|nr:MAG: DUF2892 domain-containing protein [bacterium]
MARNADRVRAHTSPEVATRIDNEAVNRVRYYAPLNDAKITRHIEELDREWDVERHLEMSASSLALTGLVLSFVHNRKWLMLTGFVLPFLLQHAVQGWCPPLTLFRRLGIRTRKEIDEEKYAMKALRGDFDGVSTRYSTDEVHRAGRAINAVRT